MCKKKKKLVPRQGGHPLSRARACAGAHPELRRRSRARDCRVQRVRGRVERVQHNRVNRARSLHAPHRAGNTRAPEHCKIHIKKLCRVTSLIHLDFSKIQILNFYTSYVIKLTYSEIIRDKPQLAPVKSGGV